MNLAERNLTNEKTQLDDVYDLLAAQRDKLQFVETTLYAIAGHKINFLDSVDEDTNSNVLHGLVDIISEATKTITAVMKQVE